MAGFTQLPDSVIVGVAKYVQSVRNKNTSSAWGPLLALLSICRSWRKAILPVVYSKAFIECYSEANSCDTQTGKSYRGCDTDDYTKIKWITNIDLLLATNNWCFAKELNIKLEPETLRLRPFISKVSEILDLQNTWDNISSLNMSLYPGFMHSHKLDVTQAFSEANLENAVERLTRCLPNICAILVKGNDKDRSSVFGGKVVSHYADKLARLQCYESMKLTVSSFSPQLTRLAVDGPALLSGQFPAVDLEMLESLRLDNLPFYFSWNCFARSEAHDQMVFPKLKSLTIQIGENYSNTGYMPFSRKESSIGASFPALERLSIVHGSKNCPILDKCAFPNNLSEIRIYCKCNSDLIQNYLTKMTVSKLFIALDSDGCRFSKKLYKTYCSLINRIKVTNGITMSLGKDVKIKSPFWTYKWKGVTKAIFDDSTYLIILGRLVVFPDIQAIEINYLNIQTNSNSYIDGLCVSDKIVENRLNTKLKAISLTFDLEECPVENAVVFVKYLMLNIESLICVKVPEALVPYIDDYVVGEMWQNPRLLHIQITST
ncbi:hypothetical protein BX070DRAFT_20730 [Coemansia spiralis]|nr:hypothetical protein BX070DRAFT_20730 [Coemansia spiralis]